MNRRSIDESSFARERCVFASCLFRQGDQIGDFAKRSFLSGSGNLNVQASGQVHFARGDSLVRADRNRAAFAGEERFVEFAVSFGNHAVHGNPFAGAGKHEVSDSHGVDRHFSFHSAVQPDCPVGLESRELLCRRPRYGPGSFVEIPAGEKEEGQCERCIEIDVLSVLPRLEERHACSQRDRKRDRSVHIHPPIRQRSARADEERACRIGQRRQRDKRGQPLHHAPCRPFGAGPDDDGEQHYVEQRESRHSDPYQKGEAHFFAFIRSGRPRLQLARFESQPGNPISNRIGID